MKYVSVKLPTRKCRFNQNGQIDYSWRTTALTEPIFKKKISGTFLGEIGKFFIVFSEKQQHISTKLHIILKISLLFSFEAGPSFEIDAPVTFSPKTIYVPD